MWVLEEVSIDSLSASETCLGPATGRGSDEGENGGAYLSTERSVANVPPGHSSSARDGVFLARAPILGRWKAS